jgi:uncharacterized protein involved in exopolysaccharide biosynthesis
MDAETRRVTSSFSAVSTVNSGREAKLRAAIEEQKQRLLEIRNERDQLAVLQRDVDAAKHADDAVTKRFTEQELASHSTQANVAVLTPAMAPLEPSFPKPLPKMLAIAVALAVFAAFAAAFLLEILSRRVRTPSDLAALLPIPVLGEISRPTRRGGLLARNSPLLLSR